MGSDGGGPVESVRRESDPNLGPHLTRGGRGSGGGTQGGAQGPVVLSRGGSVVGSQSYLYPCPPPTSLPTLALFYLSPPSFSIPTVDYLSDPPSHQSRT